MSTDGCSVVTQADTVWSMISAYVAPQDKKSLTFGQMVLHRGLRESYISAKGHGRMASISEQQHKEHYRIILELLIYCKKDGLTRERIASERKRLISVTASEL